MAEPTEQNGLDELVAERDVLASMLHYADGSAYYRDKARIAELDKQIAYLQNQQQ